VLENRFLTIASSSSISRKSLGFCRGRHSCRFIRHWKTQLAGWRGNFLSIVNLFLVFHSAQHWAAKYVHSIRLHFGFSGSRTSSHSCLDRRFQFTLNITLTPLQRNFAMTHWKKMWSTFSGLPQRTQLPSDGPPLA
jgi:hypothetical protein